MLSPSHKENILDKRWKETGIGIAIASDGTYFFTQVFILK
ncbi:MAG: CAP domain-containing protein [Pyrinomonadaceae bacterium]